VNPSLISDEMRSAVARVVGERVSFPIAASDIRRWAQAIYYPEPPPAYFWDRSVAMARFGSMVAPEEFNPFAWMTAEGPPAQDATSRRAGIGPENLLGIAPPPVYNVLNGGMEVEYTGVRMREGDIIVAVTTLVDYRERTGQLGPMLFTTTEETWSNERGETIKSQRSTLIRY